MEDNNKYEKYIKLLEANKNLILTGAPGTGKHIYKSHSRKMDAEYDFVQFHLPMTILIFRRFTT